MVVKLNRLLHICVCIWYSFIIRSIEGCCEFSSGGGSGVNNSKIFMYVDCRMN